MSILSIYAAYRLTRIVEWSVGRKKRMRPPVLPGSHEEKLLIAIARELGERGLYAHAAGILHALSFSQREIARALGVGQTSVWRSLQELHRNGLNRYESE